MAEIATFTPPVAYDLPWVLPETRGVQYDLFKYYGPGPRGRSVIKISGVYTTVDNPTQDQIDAAGAEGVGHFLGGHVYTITAAVATALTAAGYGSYVS